MTNLVFHRNRKTSLPYPLFHAERPGNLPLVMTNDEFARAFPGENDYVEFKQGVSNKKIQDAAVAFSNLEGGVLLIGARNSGAIIGLNQPGESAREVHEAIKDASNCGRYEIRELTVDSKVVLVVSIERRHEGFAQTSEGVVRQRKGASNPPLKGPELSRFIAERAFHSFESTPTPFTLDDADAILLTQLSEAFDLSNEDVDTRLREAGLLSNGSDKLKLTVAGSLLLLKDPSAIGCRAYIDIRRYGADSDEPDKTWTVSGAASEQIIIATRDVIDELGVTSAVLGARRVDMPKLPPRAVREAIANAVAHRSYQDAGSAIRIEIRQDKVVIISPGGLPEPVTINNIRSQQAARNDVVLRALRRLGLAEDLGKGIDRIEDDMTAGLLEPPIFEDDGRFFSLTLKTTGTFTSVERAWILQLIDNDKLSPRSAPVLVEAARRGTLTNSDVRSLLGVDSVIARSLLQGLVNAGALLQEGDRGGAHYRVSPTAGAPARIRYSDEEFESMILDLATKRPISNSDVRERTGLDRTDTAKLLRHLVESGKLIVSGSKRGTRYTVSE